MRKGGFHPPCEPPEQGRLPCTCPAPIFLSAHSCYRMSHAVLCGDTGRFFIGISMRMRRSRYIFCAHRANSRGCLRRCLVFGYVARCCSQRNARLSCGADNGGRNTFPHTISPFTPFNSVLLRSGAFRFLKPDCVAWLLSNNRKRLLLTFPRFCNSPVLMLLRLFYCYRCNGY